MPTHVIGTAGHVDHGKSTLVTALTGINPDRLKEEQAREMTIELGFAWCKLPSGEEIGIVDVPGHRDFIENMLAGIGGIDAVLFVIAADEGIMPQTREHLAIVDLLKVPRGIIVLTKIDLVPDQEWLTLLEDDIRAGMQGTILADAPLVRVSARTGSGIPELKQLLAQTLADTPQRLDIGAPRLPVDRVFSMPGFGTIVTGTLSNGSFHAGDEVDILPAGLRCRIRGLQNHKHKVDTAQPGQRLAINLGGVPLEDVHRGDVITKPGTYQPSRRLDVHFELLPDVINPLKHRDAVKFFIGSSEIQGSARILGVEELKPGEQAFLQIELDQPVVTQKGDRFILRRPSPGETLGGGTVVEVRAARRYKRFSAEVLESLEKKLSGSAADRLLAIIQAESPILVENIYKRSTLDEEQTSQEISALISQGLVHLAVVSDNERANYLLADTYLKTLIGQVSTVLEKFHTANPLRSGMAREELRSKIKQTPKLFNYLMDELGRLGIIAGNAQVVWLASFSVKLNPAQQKAAEQLLGLFKDNKFTPPSVKECQEVGGFALYHVLIEKGDLVQITDDIVFDGATYQFLKEDVVRHIQQNGSITVADFRDKYRTTRKYALAILEHFDAINLTKRDGDLRRLARAVNIR
jgi:selenocysteine-specific elongation factor